MSRTSSIAITTGLIGSGVLAWALAGRPLLGNPDLKAPLNPLGIKCSPYGEVFAMALQGPIGTEFHVGITGGSVHKHEPEPGNLLIVKPASTREPRQPQLSMTDRLRKALDSMAKGAVERTNPRPASEALKFYLRRQAEDKLRFAYNLDPSHYANYNSLHFFLIEGITTRPELTPSAAKLAQDTIDYCLKQKDDPRPALTAAAACTNILHVMFADRRNETPKYDTAKMRQCLNLLDTCIARYDHIARQWDESNNWERLSPQRISECEDRINFIRNIRNAADKTIVRFETGANHHHQASN